MISENPKNSNEYGNYLFTLFNMLRLNVVRFSTSVLRLFRRLPSVKVMWHGMLTYNVYTLAYA